MLFTKASLLLASCLSFGIPNPFAKSPLAIADEYCEKKCKETPTNHFRGYAVEPKSIKYLGLLATETGQGSVGCKCFAKLKNSAEVSIATGAAVFTPKFKYGCVEWTVEHSLKPNQPPQAPNSAPQGDVAFYPARLGCVSK